MRLFVSYSPEDEDLKKELLQLLAPAIRAGVLSPWDPSQVVVGDEQPRIIEAEIERADVALVLLSAGYLDTGGPADRDLVRIQELSARGGLRVVPVILSSCDWQAEVRLKDLQVLPRDGRPIRLRSDRKEALMQVCREIVALASAPRPSGQAVRPLPAPVSSPVADKTSEARPLRLGAQESPTIAPASSATVMTRPPRPGAQESPLAMSWRNPGSVLSAAVASVPVMKYALGVAGLAAVVAIGTRGFGLDAGTATVGSFVVLALMVVLIVLAIAARQSRRLVLPAMVLTWAILLFTLGSSALLLQSLFFNWPRPLRCLVHEELCVSKSMLRTPPAAEQPTLDSPLNPALSSIIDLPIESIPSRAKVWSANNTLLCTTPCSIRVPANMPLKLYFDYPGRAYTWETNNPAMELLRGGVRVNVLPRKVP